MDLLATDFSEAHTSTEYKAEKPADAIEATLRVDGFSGVRPSPSFVRLEDGDGRLWPVRMRNSTFEFCGLPDGEYKLTVEDPSLNYWEMQNLRPGVKVRAELSGSSGLRLHLDVINAPLGCSYDVELRREGVFAPSNTLRLSGISCDEPLAVFPCLPSGDYSVRVSTGEMKGSAMVLSLEPGETRDVWVAVSSSSSIVGSAVYSDGSPASGVEVTLLSAIEDPDIANADRCLLEGLEKSATGPDGHFALALPHSGQFILHAMARNGAEATSAPFYAEQVKSNYTLVLERGGFVEGTLVTGVDCNGLRVWIGTEDTLRGLRAIETTSVVLGSDCQFLIGPIPSGVKAVYLMLPSPELGSGRLKFGFKGLVNCELIGSVLVRDGERIFQEFVASANLSRLFFDVRVNGDPAVGLVVTLTRRDHASPAVVSGETDAHGAVGPLLVFAGQWGVEVRDPINNWRYSLESPLFAQGASRTVAIDIALVEVHLRLRENASAFPLPDASFLVFQGKDGIPSQFPMMRGRTDKDGRARIELPCGTYRIQLEETVDPEAVGLEWDTLPGITLSLGDG